MSDSITDRIAAITRRHREELHEEDVCICGYHGNWATHVAEMIVDQLGLTEETRTNGMSSCGMTTDYWTGVTTTHSDIRYDRRYVTKWGAV